MEAIRIRRRVLVTGRVQGVFFRSATERTASALGVDGWVRNLPDDRVEAVFEGAAPAVMAAVEWTRTGPTHARVDSVDVVDEEPEGLTGFRIRQAPDERRADHRVR